MSKNKRGKELVKWQKLSTVEGKQHGESSPYWERVEDHQMETKDGYDSYGIEYPEANPDALSESDSMYSQNPTEEAKDAYEAIITNGGVNVLSPKQLEVFKLMFEDSLTEKEIASKLNMSTGSVSNCVKEIRKKLQKELG